jgi:uncharacterized protein (DUF1015 family)
VGRKTITSPKSSSLIRPFTGLRPAAGRAGEVAAPPYDVVSASEARRIGAAGRWSFLHLSRPEIDLPPDTDPYAPEVYAKGAVNLKAMIDAGVLLRDPKPCYYVYRLESGDHVQMGLVLVASVAAYEANRVRRHEFTRPEKEKDRIRQIEVLNAQTGPVLLAYKSDDEVNRAIEQSIADSEPVYDVDIGNGVRHRLWVIEERQHIEGLSAAFDAMDALYIADGHHRSAAAARVAENRRLTSMNDSGDASSDYFLAVAFPHDRMRILDYNRVVADLNGLSPSEFLSRIRERFSVAVEETAVRPRAPGEFGMYFGGQWYRLVLPREAVPAGDPVAKLDASLLTDQLLAPILGIGDLRRDRRIDFVGGIRGLEELEARVDSGAMAIAFSLFPTSMEDLMAVADAGQVMPPKSTWFEPKLADGLVSHVLD